MKILAIETSCDDTCVAVLKTDGENFEFLSNVISSQIEIHREWGGIHPTLAKREHQKNLVPVLTKALAEAELLEKGNSYLDLSEVLNREDLLSENLSSFLKKHAKPEIDFIATTIGPGLDPALWTGVNTAKALSFCWNTPLVQVNHIKAHFLAPIVLESPEFPIISLIASGGHTELVLSKKVGDHSVIGKTRDDAAGECFDKTARILGLDYPGGPEIELLAKEKTSKKVSLPRPMLKTDDYDFSFSGLKTAVLYRVKEEKPDRDYKIAMAKEIQEAIIEVLLEKSFRAVEEFKAKTLVVGGGVSANKLLRESFKSRESDNLKVILPDIDLSTDNAKMIALAGYLKIKEGDFSDPKEVKSRPNLKIK